MNLFPTGWKIPVGNKLRDDDGFTLKEVSKPKNKDPLLTKIYFQLAGKYQLEINLQTRKAKVDILLSKKVHFRLYRSVL